MQILNLISVSLRSEQFFAMACTPYIIVEKDLLGRVRKLNFREGRGIMEGGEGNFAGDSD